jgi:hypothetical protein
MQQRPYTMQECYRNKVIKLYEYVGLDYGWNSLWSHLHEN